MPYTTKTFATEAEAEASMRKGMPPMVWKYRDWANDIHKKCLTVPAIYFAHPKSLNDPFDIRLPHVFDYSEVNHPRFHIKLAQQTHKRFPNVPVPSLAFDAMVAQQYQIIKQDPKAYFERNFKDMRDGDVYDVIGLFSVSKSPVNESLWGYYANSGKGICIGYDSVLLHKYTRSSSGNVDYNDEPVKHSFIEEQDPILSNIEHFRKHPKWSHEEEYRYITFVNADRERVKTIPRDCIKEVVLGYDASEEHAKEIIEVLKIQYLSNVSLFVIERNLTAFGFVKKRLEY